MALDKIRGAVLDAAQSEAARIVHAAEKQAADRLAVQKAQAQEETERRYQAKSRAIEEEYARKLMQTKGVANKQVLDKRNACLLRVFEEARKRILAWPQAEYAAVMRRLLDKAAEGRGGALRVHPDERSLFEKIIGDINAHPGGRLTLDTSTPLVKRGGFVLVTEQFEVDQTLDAILRDIEHELLPEIAASLFPAAQEKGRT